MADLPEGLDLDTDEGFGAALAAQVDRSETPVVEEPAAEEESTQGLPRDDQGRFAPVAQSEEPVEGAAPTEAQEETPDPWAEAPPELRAEYERVKREATEAQSLIGRQGNELGELRQKVEGVEARLEAKPEGPPPAIPTATANEEVEEFVAEHGGRAAMEWVVENRPDLIDTTLKAWAEEDPGEAAIFAGRLAAFEAAQAAAPAPAEPVDDRQQQLSNAIVTLQTEVKDWEAIKPHLMPALEDASTPTLIKEAVADPDPKRQLEGVRALAEFARSRALAAATAQATSERGEQVAASKTAAQVASGSLRPAPTREPSSQEPSENIKTFYERILSAENTSDLSSAIERRQQ